MNKPLPIPLPRRFYLDTTLIVVGLFAVFAFGLTYIFEIMLGFVETPLTATLSGLCLLIAYAILAHDLAQQAEREDAFESMDRVFQHLDDMFSQPFSFPPAPPVTPQTFFSGPRGMLSAYIDYLKEQLNKSPSLTFEQVELLSKGWFRFDDNTWHITGLPDTVSQRTAARIQGQVEQHIEFLGKPIQPESPTQPQPQSHEDEHVTQNQNRDRRRLRTSAHHIGSILDDRD